MEDPDGFDVDEVIRAARNMRNDLAGGLLAHLTAEQLSKIYMRVKVRSRRHSKGTFPAPTYEHNYFCSVGSPPRVRKKLLLEEVLEILHPAPRVVLENGPLAERGLRELEKLSDLRSKKAEKKKIGSKSDEPKVQRAQREIDLIIAAAELWAMGDRSPLVQRIKNMLAYRHIKQLDNGKVEITKEAMLQQVSYNGGVDDKGKRNLAYGTLREWAKAGHLHRIPKAKRKNG